MGDTESACPTSDFISYGIEESRDYKTCANEQDSVISGQTDSKTVDQDIENCSDNIDDDEKIHSDDDDLSKIIPKIVISEPQVKLPSPSSNEKVGASSRLERTLLSAKPRRRVYGTPNANSDWSRNKPLREARKKNTAILPSTFAALSMSRRFSSPDPSEDAVRAQKRFLEKLNQRRRSEQSELAQKVNEFMKQSKLNHSEHSHGEEYQNSTG